MRMHYNAFTYLIKYPNCNLLFLKQIMNISQHFDPCFDTHDKGFFIQSAEKCSQNYNLLVRGNFYVKMNQYFTVSVIWFVIIPLGSCLKCYVCNNLRNTVQVSLKTVLPISQNLFAIDLFWVNLATLCKYTFLAYLRLIVYSLRSTYIKF